MGGNIALAATALDHRITVVATALAEADWSRPGSTIPLSAPNTAIQNAFDRFNPLTNLGQYQHCPAMSFQCGSDDQLIPPGGAQRFVDALAETYTQCPEKLELILEDGISHQFTQQMWTNALRWFQRFL